MIEDKDFTQYGWYTVNEFSRKKGVTNQAIRWRIKKNTLETFVYQGLLYVAEVGTTPPELPEQPENVPPEPAPQQHSPSPVTEKLLIENQLKREKLLNLKQDTILKKLKNQYTKQMYRQQYVQGVFQCFTESFSKLKNALIQLKLSKQQNEKLKKIIAKSIKEFQNNLKKYLTEKDKLETGGDNEENQAI